MGIAKRHTERGQEQAGMSREGRRTMEKVLENTVRDTFTYAHVCLTLAIRIFSTNLKFLNLSGTFPNHRLLANARRGTLPFLTSFRQVSQICEHA